MHLMQKAFHLLPPGLPATTQFRQDWINILGRLGIDNLEEKSLMDLDDFSNKVKVMPNTPK